MEIQIEYGSDGKLGQELLDEIRDVARRHGNLSEKKWGMRAGAIDLVTVLEIVGIYTGMKILDGFVEGLIGKDIFENIGRKLRKEVFAQANNLRNFLGDLYERTISKNRDRYGSFAIIEHINDFSLYVVINHKKMNSNLIEKLPEAMALAVIVTINTDFEDDPPHAIQLYPNFETESWDYIFMPTTQAYGNYIDRYFDLKDRTLHLLSSPDEFINKFNPDDKDDFKFLISPNRDHKKI
ncbi:MAG TPA: hypothetical protein VMX17_13680 [Candidatus Glassbacteria bacterium]|nr:hypothetical protein [Candidatus Glassbacteria bacterium]